MSETPYYPPPPMFHVEHEQLFAEHVFALTLTYRTPNTEHQQHRTPKHLASSQFLKKTFERGFYHEEP